MNFVGRELAVAEIGIGIGPRAIGEEHDPVVSKHRISGRRVAAVFRRHARHNHSLDALTTKYHVQISAVEGAVPVLLDDHLVFLRRDFGTPAIRNRRIDIRESAHVGAVGAMHMGGIDDPNTDPPSLLQNS